MVFINQNRMIRYICLLSFLIYLLNGFTIQFPHQLPLSENYKPQQTSCRFAHQYNRSQILQDPQTFLKDYIKWQTKFIREVGMQNSTGMTYDGYRLDVDKGVLLNGGLHYWTASSKESIHVGLLAHALYNNYTEIYSIEEIFQIISKKIVTFEGFYKRYPGFGGYFPWVYLNGSEPVPTYDFASRTPALDNGELFWAALALSHAWNKIYPERDVKLRERWDNITWRPMIKNAKKIFYNETTKKIRAVANILNISKTVKQNQYTNNDDYYLDDPYEGQLFHWIITLFPNSETNFTEQEIQYILVDKRKKLQSANFYIPQLKQNITVEKGWWFSAHQQWKHLFMPYRDVPHYAKIMQNKEKARTWNSALKLLPGMYASVTGPAAKNTDNMDYYSDCGIQSISFNKVQHTLMVTPYSAFPLLLLDRKIGAAWLHNMLYSPAGQNIYGATEATQIDGHGISPVLTWDSKITTVLAILGGNVDIIRDYLRENQMAENFYSIIDRQYRNQIPNIQGTDLNYSLPTTIVNKGRADFPNCKL